MIYDGGSCNFMFHLAGTTLKIKSSYQIYWQLQLDNRKRSTRQEKSPVGPTSVKLSDPARWSVSIILGPLHWSSIFPTSRGHRKKVYLCTSTTSSDFALTSSTARVTPNKSQKQDSVCQSVRIQGQAMIGLSCWNQITFWGGRWWEEQTWDTDPSAPGETWTLGQNPPSWSEEYCRDKEIQDSVLYVHKNTSECIYGQKRIGGRRESRSTLRFKQKDDLRGWIN